MEENRGESTSSIFNEVAELLPESSDTLSTLSLETTQQQLPSQKPTEWSLGNAPVKSEDSPNYELFKQSFEEGNNTALIDANNTPENLQTAVNMLLQSPELKDYIGQYALSNDVEKNINLIQSAISSQKNFEATPERIGEVDGKVFTGGEAYFLQELLNRVQHSDAANTFFTQLREQINTEVVEKIEEKNKQQINTKQPNNELTSNLQSETSPDALQQVAELLNEREGTIVEETTTDEKLDELKRIFSTPEYKQARIEELGYDPETGHPDLEIREYLKAKAEYAKQPYHDQGPEPVKPENFEERLKQPKANINSSLNVSSNPLTLFQSEEKNSSEQPSIIQNIEPFKETNLLEQPSLVQNIEPTNLLNPIQQDFNETKFTDLLSNFSPQQETSRYETVSELPTQELFVQAERPVDETSDEILANTKQTNTTLQALTQMLATFIQSGGMSSQQNTPIPVPMPTGQTNAQPGIPDAVLASGQGMIPSIRSKFIYSV